MVATATRQTVGQKLQTDLRLTPRILLEALVGLDWLRLRTSAVYWGIGVPQGSGAPVVLVPGFLGTDRYLMEMFHWLRRIGYRSYYSGIGRNAECPDLLLARLLETVGGVYTEAGQRVHLIGHSFGGTITRVAAAHRPDLVAQVITLGSPISSARINPAVMAAVALVRGRIHRGNNGGPPTCYTEACSCTFVSSVGEVPPPTVKRACIIAKGDGVVDERCCRDFDPSCNIVVKGTTHLGLPFNQVVYRELARLLSETTRCCASRRASA